MGALPGHLVSTQGAIDMHFHSAPCLFQRLATDRQVAEAASRMGFGGVQFKCHHENTVSRALALQRDFPELHLFGGIVVNTYVGGINPKAVEAALLLGAKSVWLPTIDSVHHVLVHGGTGQYETQSAGGSTSKCGISAVRDGMITAEAKTVFELIAEHGAILGTSHQSYDELSVIIPAARQIGVKKISLTHPFYVTPGLTLPQIQEFINMGAIAEFGYCTVSPMWASATLRQVAGAIKTLGAEHCILMSDGGQRHNPIPPEALRIFAQSLFELGVQEGDIDTMIRKNPARLLGLEPDEVRPSARGVHDNA